MGTRDIYVISETTRFDNIHSDDSTVGGLSSIQCYAFPRVG